MIQRFRSALIGHGPIVRRVLPHTPRLFVHRGILGRVGRGWLGSSAASPKIVHLGAHRSLLAVRPQPRSQCQQRSPRPCQAHAERQTGCRSVGQLAGPDSQTRLDHGRRHAESRFEQGAECDAVIRVRLSGPHQRETQNMFETGNQQYRDPTALSAFGSHFKTSRNEARPES